MVLAKFTSFDEKLKLFHGRDDLRRAGIRVANDLTIRQRTLLKDIRLKGLNGYLKEVSCMFFHRRILLLMDRART
jgi:hypothetical protein